MFFVGVDIVAVPGFREQLAMPGSTFDQVFTALELRTATTRPDRALHLAGRWAAKEAFIKAWSQALYGRPPAMSPEAVDFREIEVRSDGWGRVDVDTRGLVAEAVRGSIGEIRTSLSISHDGDYATATCLVVTG
ncbi:Holo-[acyl-carrier-protein] synthase [Corynebacterium atrinae]|uniref:holo-ACP synthase AcpS n=1 Tax=Corynebacterium atrinae TaxID=1336740 RepID=UPI0025B3F15A|nr:holo-ACP synthase [Corynebacterium atrinae]WJY64087.1 Holo-[acyl-carrier-protein] synthase [Corynebacterium atrinae]